MPPKRGKDGKFISTDADEVETANGFFQELLAFLSLAYRTWRLLPMIIVIIVFWRWTEMSKKITEILIEILCGNGCTCNCASTKKTGL
jgi:hypothetical protein